MIDIELPELKINKNVHLKNIKYLNVPDYGFEQGYTEIMYSIFINGIEVDFNDMSDEDIEKLDRIVEDECLKEWNNLPPIWSADDDFERVN